MTTESPVAIIITPGNHYDGHELRPLLEKVTIYFSRWFHAVIDGKRYDAGYKYLDIVEYFQALPIIPIQGNSDLLWRKQLTLNQFFIVPRRIRPTATN